MYAGWLTRARRGAARGPAVPARRAGGLGRPHVPRRDARPPHVPAARHDRRRRRRRGVRQGRPPAGPRVPGRTRDHRGGRARDRHATGCSPARGWGTRTTSASRASRRPRAGSSRRRAPTRACRPTSAMAAAPGRPGRRARLGVPGLGGRRPRDQDDPGGRGDERGGDRARRRRRLERGPPGTDRRGEAEARGLRVTLPAPGPVHGQRGDDRRGRGAAAGRGRPRRTSTSTPATWPLPRSRG